MTHTILMSAIPQRRVLYTIRGPIRRVGKRTGTEPNLIQTGKSGPARRAAHSLGLPGGQDVKENCRDQTKSGPDRPHRRSMREAQRQR